MKMARIPFVVWKLDYDYEPFASAIKLLRLYLSRALIFRLLQKTEKLFAA